MDIDILGSKDHQNCFKLNKTTHVYYFVLQFLKHPLDKSKPPINQSLR